MQPGDRVIVSRKVRERGRYGSERDIEVEGTVIDPLVPIEGRVHVRHPEPINGRDTWAYDPEQVRPT